MNENILKLKSFIVHDIIPYILTISVILIVVVVLETIFGEEMVGKILWALVILSIPFLGFILWANHKYDKEYQKKAEDLKKDLIPMLEEDGYILSKCVYNVRDHKFDITVQKTEHAKEMNQLSPKWQEQTKTILKSKE